jgi:RNA polymerase sigma factor (sigma-70 family)
MVRIHTHAGWKHIDRLFEAGSMVGLTDRQLLDRFLAGESAEAAFEALVDRHGPMVRSVCRSVLRDAHEADDAFQAVFLVLASRARAIRRRDAVGSWLYGVACRVAARARADAGHRRQLERSVAERASHRAPMSRQPSEPMPEVLDEVEGLPERYRAPIVLCYLEGQSHEQAARTLGCPLRTLQTRLERGKARLRSRLVRRGFAPTVGLLAMGLESAEAAPVVLGGSVPAALLESTVRVSMQFARAHDASLATTSIRLARGVIQTHFWNRLIRAASIAFGLAMGLALTCFALAPADEQPDKSAKTIIGRILDDQGRPISGAAVWMPVWFESKADKTSHATADRQGNYALTVHDAWARSSLHERQPVVWAYAPGHRIASANASLALSGKPKSVDLTLGPATDTSFIVFGPDGRPAAGAVVEPYQILAPYAYVPPPAAMLPSIRSVADETGRASLPTIAREGFTSVKVTTSSLGEQQLSLRGHASEPARREVRLRPAGRIEGHIVAARPEWTRGVKIYLSTLSPSDPSVQVSTLTQPDPFGHAADKTEGVAEVVTGDDGTFIVPAIAEGKLILYARVDQALPVRQRPIGDVVIRSNQTTKLAIFLQKSVRVWGAIRVTGSHEPVVGASVSIAYGLGDRQKKIQPDGTSMCVSDAMGRFETYIMPGEAGISVFGMPEPFVRLEGPTFVPFGPVADDAETVELPPIEVARGVTVTGRLVDAQDRPMAHARLVAGHASTITDRYGDFTMSGVPAGPRPAYHVNLRPQDKSSVIVEIVRENPLLLRAPIMAPRNVMDPSEPKSVSP